MTLNEKQGQHLKSMPYAFTEQGVFYNGQIYDADVDYYELYDLKTAPNELHNLYSKKGMEKVERDLKKKLATYRKNLQVDE